MKRAPRSRQRHDLYAKYHDYDSEISDLLGECGIIEGRSIDLCDQAINVRRIANEIRGFGSYLGKHFVMPFVGASSQIIFAEQKIDRTAEIRDQNQDDEPSKTPGGCQVVPEQYSDRKGQDQKGMKEEKDGHTVLS